MSFNYLAILPVCSAVLCVALGLFTLSRNARHLSNIGFAGGMLCLAITEAGSALMLLSVPETMAHTQGLRLYTAGQSLIPPAWLVFSIVFARGNYREILAKWSLPLIALSLVSVHFIIHTRGAGFITPVQVAEGQSMLSFTTVNLTFDSLGRYFYIYMIIGSVLNLLHLENTLRSSTGSKRWRIKYVIIGVGAILAFYIYHSSRAILFSAVEMESMLLGSAVVLISTVMMAVFIVSHRLLDVDIYISRYVVYNSITVVAVGIYLVAVGVVAHAIKYFNVPFDFFLTALFVFVSMLALVVMLFTASLRRKLQNFITKNFYKHKYQFRDKWMETIEKLSSRRTADDVKNTLRQMIITSMCARHVFIWTYDPKSALYTTDSEDVPENLSRIDLSHPFCQFLADRTGPFDMTEAATGGPGVGEVFKDTASVLCTPLLSGTDAIGFILQGADISGEKYGSDDYEYLKAVSTQAAVELKNIRLADELASAREVEAFSKMSSFIMHDLKNLTNSLSLLNQNARFNINNPEFQQDAIRSIDSTVVRMKGLIEKLSTLPTEIELKKKPFDIRDVIDRAIKKSALPPDKDVTILLRSEAEDLPYVDIDSEAVEMVFMNLVVNAYDAIVKRGQVDISISLNGGQLLVRVADNGPGMSAEFIEKSLFTPFRSTKKNGFGVGLYQSKSIIEAHGGTIEVESATGRGTAFTLKFPLDTSLQSATG